MRVDGANWRHPEGPGTDIIARSAGLNQDMMEPLVDNTEIYALMHRTLFGDALN